MTASGGTPGGGTPCATRSFTCWPTLASEWLMPSRPTPRDPKVRCQLKPVALRQPS